MRRTRIVTVVAAVILIAVSASMAWAGTSVHGCTRRNGTYVQQHWRSNPDRSPYNNYSFPGNANPHTGKIAPGNPDTYLRNRYGHGKRHVGR
jgi:hypothetical protein